jgi:hypothetical protein
MKNEKKKSEETLPFLKALLNLQISTSDFSFKWQGTFRNGCHLMFHIK